MNRSLLRVIILGSSVMFMSQLLSGCGVEGKYADQTGMINLELQSSGKATLGAMGQSEPCTYTTDGDKVAITCHGETTTFTKQSDGSLAPPAGAMIGLLKKK
jgi:hypothetical protein